MEQEIEIWKDIPGYEGYYQVSSIGRVKSLERKTESISPRHNRSHLIIKENIRVAHIKKLGYYEIRLQVNKLRTNHSVHRLVAQAFIPNIENKEQVNHINGIKTDNRVENLEWATRSENVLHAFKIGLACRKGIKNSAAKLTETDVKEIKILLKEGFSIRSLSEKFKVYHSTIQKIKYNHTWKHLTE